MYHYKMKSDLEKYIKKFIEGGIPVEGRDGALFC
jgi:hypothetical protein